MKPQIMWSWLNRGGHVMSVHTKRNYAVRDAVNNGYLPPAKDDGMLEPKVRWRRLRKMGHKVVQVRVSVLPGQGVIRDDE